MWFSILQFFSMSAFFFVNGFLIQRDLIKGRSFHLLMALSFLRAGVFNASWLVVEVVTGRDWVWDLVWTLLAFVLVFFFWWHGRRPRRNVLKAIGAKARALLAQVAESAQGLADRVRAPIPGVQPAPAG